MRAHVVTWIVDPLLHLSVAGAIVAGSGCSSPPERVVIGVAVNESTHEAVRLATEEINAEGGVGGVRLELMGLDWSPGMADPESLIEWAHRFAENPDLLGVIGHSDSAATLVAAPIFNQLEVPQLVTIATAPAITEIGSWTYRLCISDAQQGPALAEYAAREWGRRRIALFYVGDEYGKGLAREFRRHAEELGAEIVRSVFHPDVLADADRDHLRSVLETLRELPASRRPDLFMLIQRGNAAAWTIREIRRLGLEAPILGADNFTNKAFLARLPPEIDGLRASSFYVGPGDDPGAREFERRYRERAGRPPDYGDAYAYDAVHLLRDAMAQGGFSREGVKAYLDRLIEERRVVEGVTGRFSLKPNHDARRALTIVEYRHGEFVPIETIGVD